RRFDLKRCSMATINEVEIRTQPVEIPIDGVLLSGDLALVEDAQGIVLFAHGSGSSRHSSRNKFVAAELNRAGIATLLFDLLTEQEESEEQFTRHLRFDIELLSRRLAAATDFVAADSRLSNLSQGY